MNTSNTDAEQQRQREHDPVAGDLYLAGERVPPGVYKEVRSGRRVHLDRDDVLPATLDGRVACYARLRFGWSRGHQG